jgi:hypothetical protein
MLSSSQPVAAKSAEQIKEDAKEVVNAENSARKTIWGWVTDSKKAIPVDLSSVCKKKSDNYKALYRAQAEEVLKVAIAYYSENKASVADTSYSAIKNKLSTAGKLSLEIEDSYENLAIKANALRNNVSSAKNVNFASSSSSSSSSSISLSSSLSNQQEENVMQISQIGKLTITTNQVNPNNNSSSSSSLSSSSFNQEDKDRAVEELTRSISRLTVMGTSDEDLRAIIANSVFKSKTSIPVSSSSLSSSSSSVSISNNRYTLHGSVPMDQEKNNGSEESYEPNSPSFL